VGILGLILNFIGSLIMVWDIIFSKYNPSGITWNELEGINKEKIKARKLTLIGLSLNTVGFVIQLIEEIIKLNH